jgi:hypothetical protein
MSRSEQEQEHKHTKPYAWILIGFGVIDRGESDIDQ